MRLIQELRRRLLAEAGLPLVWIGLTVVALFVVWHQRLLPMAETPHDLAVARVWHSFHDPAYKVSDYYALRLRPLPPILFYAAVHLMMYVVSIEIANKLFLSAYLILFPLSVLALARAFRRSPWLALGGFALAFNQTWAWGSASILMGMALMNFAVAALVRWLNEGRASQAVWLSLSALLCALASVHTCFCFMLCAIALVIRYRRQWHNALFALAAIMPAAAVGIIAVHREHLSEVTATWHDFPTLVMAFPHGVMELFAGNVDRNVLALLALTVAALAVWKGTRLADDARPQRGQIGTLLAVLVSAYLLLPYDITKPMPFLVSARLPALIAPFFLLWPAIPATPPARPWSRLVFVPLIVCGVVLPLQLNALYTRFSARNIAFLRLLERVPKGSRVLVVVRGTFQGVGAEEGREDVASSTPVYDQFSSWPLAVDGGYAPYLIDHDTPLVPTVKLAAPPRADSDLMDLREAPTFDYYVIRGPDDMMERQPSLKVQERWGEWVLFKRRFAMTDEP